ncbi:MAG: DMT family transporter [bacterium]|nr:DMT family transporter [bacterium]
MLWLIYSLICALSLAILDALCKDLLQKENALLVSLIRWGYALPFLFLFFLFIKIPPLDRTFWLTVAILAPLEITAVILYMRGIQISPLSLSIPFFALTPVFMIGVAYVLLGEVPDRSGVAGILLVAAGAYIISLDSLEKGWLEPFRAIARERGVVLIIVVAVIYSVTSVLGKIAVLHSSPEFFGVFYIPLLTLVLLPVSAAREGQGVLRLFNNFPRFVLIGIFSALMIITHFLAVRLVDVAYMISVKRLSLIFSVILGRVFFHEEYFTQRLAGSLVMLLGVVLIIL